MSTRWGRSQKWEPMKLQDRSTDRNEALAQFITDHVNKMDATRGNWDVRVKDLRAFQTILDRRICRDISVCSR